MSRLTVVARKRRTYDDDQIKDLKDQIAILKSYTEQLEHGTQIGAQNALEFKSLDNEADAGNEHGSESGEGDYCDSAGDISPSAPRGVADLDGRLPHAVDELSRLLWTTHIGREGETSFQGPSGNFSFQQPSVSRATFLAGVVDDTDADPMAQYYIHNADIKQDLATSFMEHINTYHFFVDKDFDQTLLFDPQNPLPLQFLHAAILAAGSCYTRNASSATAGRAFATFAESVALECCREHPSDQVISGLAILSWMKLSLEENHMGWMYNAMAASLVIHLGLHYPLAINLDKTQTERAPFKAAKQRIFWSVCLMDRIATVMLGRNCAIPWRRIRVAFPDLVEQDKGREVETIFALQCQLSFLFDKYMDQIYAFDFDDKDPSSQLQLLMGARDALFRFQDEMSEHCPMRAPDAPSGACLLHTWFHMSMMLIHRPFLGVSHADSVRRVAFRATTTAATSCTRVLRNMTKTLDLSKMPFYLVHHVLTTAISHLINATSLDDRMRRTSANGLKTCLEVLDLLKGTWHARASHAVVAIQEIAHRWHVVAALPINFSEPLPGGAAHSTELNGNQDDLNMQFLAECENIDGFALPSLEFGGLDPFLELNDTFW